MCAYVCECARVCVHVCMCVRCVCVCHRRPSCVSVCVPPKPPKTCVCVHMPPKPPPTPPRTVKGEQVSATMAMATVVQTRFCRSCTCQ